MERVTSKLVRWKAVYDALSSAQAALLCALREGASDEELDFLRRQADRLHAESEAALKELDDQVVELRRSRATHH